MSENIKLQFAAMFVILFSMIFLGGIAVMTSIDAISYLGFLISSLSFFNAFIVSIYYSTSLCSSINFTRRRHSVCKTCYCRIGRNTDSYTIMMGMNYYVSMITAGSTVFLLSVAVLDNVFGVVDDSALALAFMVEVVTFIFNGCYLARGFFTIRRINPNFCFANKEYFKRHVTGQVSGMLCSFIVYIINMFDISDSLYIILLSAGSVALTVTPYCLLVNSFAVVDMLNWYGVAQTALYGNLSSGDDVQIVLTDRTAVDIVNGEHYPIITDSMDLILYRTSDAGWERFESPVKDIIVNGKPTKPKWLAESNQIPT